MRAMTEIEAAAYLEHRMRIAGHQGARVFAPQAAAALHMASDGVPRLLNIMANKALMVAFGRGALQVGAHEAWLAARDTEDARSPHLFALPSWAGTRVMAAAKALN
jgi:MSHA biogenesis protein MshM